MTSPDARERSRRNVRLALAHAAVAIALLVAFVWYQVTH